MKLVNLPLSDHPRAETIKIDGHRITIRFAPKSNEAALERIKSTMLQGQTPPFPKSDFLQK